jgi:dTDP-4-dehydrorhamnose reductase
MLKVLITGGSGQLGQELKLTAPSIFDIVVVDRLALDITNAKKVEEVISSVKPQVIVNAAAYTQVDQAENFSESAYAVNEKGVVNLAESAKKINARIIHISTDFVFDGLRSIPYFPEDKTNPLGVYGASKLAGEDQIKNILGKNAIIIRTGWLYSQFGNNFVKTMLRLLREKESIRVVADQIGTPTWARTLSQVIWEIIEKPDLNGVFHWSDAGVASWYDFAVAIQEENNAVNKNNWEKKPIYPILTKDYPTLAKRPHYSVLDKQAIYNTIDVPQLHWRECLRNMLKEFYA